jgi:hypothetical protein
VSNFYQRFREEMAAGGSVEEIENPEVTRSGGKKPVDFCVCRGLTHLSVSSRSRALLYSATYGNESHSVLHGFWTTSVVYAAWRS